MCAVINASFAGVIILAITGDWIPVTEKLAPRHETVLALSSEGEIYQARVCYGMHEPFWCGHSKLNFGKVLADQGITITHWCLIRKDY
jgi:hypothetical protein